MRILVTGASGFIGRRLCRKLLAGDEVVLLQRPGSAAVCGGMEVVRADLNDAAVVVRQIKAIKPDACIHLAWEGIPDFGYEMSRRNLDQGITLTRTLLEQCECRKLVVAGSCFEYGKAFGPCEEGDFVSVGSCFAWAKHALCDLGLMIAHGQARSFVWLRLFYVYGPGQRPAALIPTLIASLRHGRCPQLKTPSNANDFVFVDDVVDAFLLAVRNEVPSGIYNVGTGASCPVWRVCEMLETTMGRSLEFSGQMRSGLSPPSSDFWSNTAKSEQVLGWRAATSLRDGLRICLQSEDGSMMRPVLRT